VIQPNIINMLTGTKYLRGDQILIPIFSITSIYEYATATASVTDLEIFDNGYSRFVRQYVNNSINELQN